jgi:hypothetical protein|tara:strand:- start:6608 stop:7219 length:612 start_codon:yes stop_codon:yes gene_type:complete
MTDKATAQIILLPKGRLINNSLFVMDQFNDKAKPSYKLEIAFDKGALDVFNDQLLDHAVATWGKGADGDDLIIPIKSGDDLAAKREKNGKPGTAYKGMEVIRANTIYNKHGEEGPGGVQVINMDGESEIGPANKSEIYNGCYVIAAVTIGTYTDQSTGNNALTLYLAAVQKAEDGEHLTAPKDHSSLFKPVAATPSARVSRVG